SFLNLPKSKNKNPGNHQNLYNPEKRQTIAQKKVPVQEAPGQNDFISLTVHVLKMISFTVHLLR
ncbi:hypothetical protein, partial [Chitinophaga sp.]|uniref:hypothetical protein n=1 Tax=Chitinophaga sp. TaxID=1869181 RepID=UPI002F93E4AD